MRILWIAYAAIGRAGTILEHRDTESGGWIDAMKNALMPYQLELGIACVSSCSKKIIDDDQTTYYGIDGIQKNFGKTNNSQELEKWYNVINDFRPDVIMIWGTEWGNGERIIKAAKDIPVLFFIQGVLGRIVEYPVGNIKRDDLRDFLHPIAKIKWRHYHTINKRQMIQAKYERDMVSLSAGVITDNEWADSYYGRSLKSDSLFHVSLPVNPIFLNSKYALNNINRHTVFSVACNNPAKGIHCLLRAIYIVKKSYPDVTVRLPGNVNCREPKIIFKQPYIEYLESLIDKLDLRENVVFCGMLSPKEMKENLLSCNAFVMPSCIENHSSSLREAMYLGVPSISTEVGSVHEFVKHNENGLLYRYEEYEVLAAEICKLFSDDKFAMYLGNNAYSSIREKYPQEKIGEDLINAYRKVIQRGVQNVKENI